MSLLRISMQTISGIDVLDAEQLDAADPLRALHERFDLPEGVIYLNGNSLGPLPKATKKRMAEVVEQEWGTGLIRSWNTAGWVDLPQRLGALIAPLIGAESDEVIVADSTSVNLFKLIHAGLKLNPGRSKVVTELGNFPTDLYVLQGVERDASIDLCAVPRERIVREIDDQTALVVLTHVHYKSGEMFDLEALTASAHSVGALILWDLSHSTGAVPVDLNSAGADLAVGCGYKYLNGGPGAPSFLFVAKRHQARFEQPLTGWFGHAAPFAMSDQFEPAEGLTRALCGTPSVLGCVALEEGVRLASEVDMAAVRRKSIELSEFFIQQVEARLIGCGFELASPRSPELRGSQVSLKHAEAYPIMQSLIEHGVIGDFRAPDILRFGFAPLYTRFVDVAQAVSVLEQVMISQSWRDPRFQVRGRVT